MTSSTTRIQSAAQAELAAALSTEAQGCRGSCNCGSCNCADCKCDNCNCASCNCASCDCASCRA